MLLEKKNIMLVEDEIATIRFIKDVLTANHVSDICTFRSAENVLDTLDSRSCDLILMDINIQGSIDGIRLSEMIKETFEIPIIFITAYGDADIVSEAMQISPFGYIIKPFNRQELEATLTLAFTRYEIFRQNLKKDPLNQQRISLTKDMTYSLKNKILYHKDLPVKLTGKERELLYLLLHHANSVVSLDHIKLAIWQEKEVSISTLRTLVYSLRKKVPELHLSSHSKMGYILQVHTEVFD